MEKLEIPTLCDECMAKAGEAYRDNNSFIRHCDETDMFIVVNRNGGEFRGITLSGPMDKEQAVLLTSQSLAAAQIIDKKNRSIEH